MVASKGIVIKLTKQFLWKRVFTEILDIFDDMHQNLKDKEYPFIILNIFLFYYLTIDTIDFYLKTLK